MTMAQPVGRELLRLAAGGDAARLQQLLARVEAGEPAPYVAGFFFFRGRRFEIDRRAYITDPELTDLVDVVGEEGEKLAQQLGRPLRVLEFGVGAGTLALSVKLEHPGWTVSGLDVDAAALAVARRNADRHGIELDLRESDFFSAWREEEPAPDLIFGDPPWGGAEDLYDGERDELYYRQMPARSAFPPGASRCGIHDGIIARLRERRWPSLLILNYGVLPPAVVAASIAPLAERRLLARPAHPSVLVGRAVPLAAST